MGLGKLGKLLSSSQLDFESELSQSQKQQGFEEDDVGFIFKRDTQAHSTVPVPTLTLSSVAPGRVGGIARLLGARKKMEKVAKEEPVKRKRGRPRKIQTEEEEAKPKRKRGRPRKVRTAEEAEQPKRKRGRPRKVVEPGSEVEKPKRKRGRPRKVEVEKPVEEVEKVEKVVEKVAEKPIESAAVTHITEGPPKRKRGRPRKNEAAVNEEPPHPKRKPGRPRKSERPTETAAKPQTQRGSLLDALEYAESDEEANGAGDGLFSGDESDGVFRMDEYHTVMPRTKGRPKRVRKEAEGARKKRKVESTLGRMIHKVKEVLMPKVKEEVQKPKAAKTKAPKLKPDEIPRLRKKEKGEEMREKKREEAREEAREKKREEMREKKKREKRKMERQMEKPIEAPRSPPQPEFNDFDDVQDFDDFPSPDVTSRIPLKDSPAANFDRPTSRLSRRSSLSHRGKRLSSVGNGFEAEPHSDVPIEQFFKHFDQEIPDPRKMRQLLVWCCRRIDFGKSKKEYKSVELANRIKQRFTRELADGTVDVSWWNKTKKQPGNRPIRIRPNEANIKNERSLREYKVRLEKLTREETEWEKATAQLPQKVQQATAVDSAQLQQAERQLQQLEAKYGKGTRARVARLVEDLRYNGHKMKQSTECVRRIVEYKTGQVSQMLHEEQDCVELMRELARL